MRHRLVFLTLCLLVVASVALTAMAFSPPPAPSGCAGQYRDGCCSCNVQRYFWYDCCNGSCSSGHTCNWGECCGPGPCCF